MSRNSVLDLRPAHIIETDKNRKVNRVTVVIAIVYVIILLSVMYNINATNLHLGQQIDRLQEQNFNNLNDANKAKYNKELTDNQLIKFRQLEKISTVRIEWYEILTSIEKCMPESVKITTFNGDNLPELYLTGTSNNSQDILKFKEQLNSSKLGIDFILEAIDYRNYIYHYHFTGQMQ